MDPPRLFLKNLPIATTVKQVWDALTKNGLGVRASTRPGHPNGTRLQLCFFFAYYESEANVQVAVNRLNGQYFLGSCIPVVAEVARPRASGMYYHVNGPPVVRPSMAPGAAASGAATESGPHAPWRATIPVPPPPPTAVSKSTPASQQAPAFPPTPPLLEAKAKAKTQAQPLLPAGKVEKEEKDDIAKTDGLHVEEKKEVEQGQRPLPEQKKDAADTEEKKEDVADTKDKKGDAVDTEEKNGDVVETKETNETTGDVMDKDQENKDVKQELLPIKEEQLTESPSSEAKKRINNAVDGIEEDSDGMAVVDEYQVDETTDSWVQLRRLADQALQEEGEEEEEEEEEESEEEANLEETSPADKGCQKGKRRQEKAASKGEVQVEIKEAQVEIKEAQIEIKEVQVEIKEIKEVKEIKEIKEQEAAAEIDE